MNRAKTLAVVIECAARGVAWCRTRNTRRGGGEEGPSTPTHSAAQPQTAAARRLPGTPKVHPCQAGPRAFVFPLLHITCGPSPYPVEA